jgi:hypothetical protein
MGIFKNLRDGVKAMGNIPAAYREIAQQADAAAGAVPLTILNPTPQAEVDRLIAAGGVARGVVVGASHPPLQDGERVSKMQVTIRVRCRLPGGELGPDTRIKIWTSWQVATLLDQGLEIPIVLDRTTWLATDIPRDELKRELEPRFPEAARRRPGWAFDL